MINRCRYALMSLLAAILLSACAGPEITAVTQPANPSPSPELEDATQPAAPTPAVQPSLTPLPFPTAGPTSATVFPTPALPLTGEGFFDFDGFLFDDESSAACALPCWHGLVIGESGAQDVQDVLDNEFGFDHSLNFFSHITADTYNLGVLNADAAQIPDLYSIWHRWTIGAQSFVFVAGFERATNKLQITGFHWEIMDSTQFEVNMTPQSVIRRLGKPSFILAGSEGLLGGRSIIRFVLVYKQGLVFEFSTKTTTTLVWADAAQTKLKEDSTRYCLGNTKTSSDVIHIAANIYLMSPFEHGLDNLIPLQRATVGYWIDRGWVRPVEDVFGTTADEITQMSLDQDNPCLTSTHLYDN